MSVRIIIDSTVDTTRDVEEKLYVVPLTIRFGDDEYIDRITINHRQFYEKLIESDALPSTSQANIVDFDRVFSKIVQNGDTAVVITLSSKLSGTYNSALLASEEYPDKIFVVDSRSVSIGAGILAELALEYAAEGYDAPEIADFLEKDKERVKVVAMFDTLEYLKRGGRISKTAAIAGGLLAIKPVITIRDGEIAILGKARGSKQANNLLANEIEIAGGIDFTKPLLLGYTGLSDTLLNKYVEDSTHLWKNSLNALRSTVVGSVVGTHAGPGAIAVAFFKNNC